MRPNASALRTLLAALLSLGLAAPSARACEACGDVAQVHTASVIGFSGDPSQLGPLYDGSITRDALADTPVRAAPAARAPLPVRQAVPPRGLQTAPVAAPDAPPVSQEEIDRFIRFFPAAPTEADAGTVRALAQHFVQARQTEFSQAVIAKMQESEIGRRVLREVIEEARIAGVRLSMQPKTYEGSTIQVKNGTERPTGIRGQMYTGQGLYVYNAEYLNMRDRDMALEQIAGNATHEFQHMLFSLKTKRLLGSEYSDIVQRYDNMDEAWAKTVGYVAGVELNTGRSTPYTEEAAGLAANPEQFFDRMPMWGKYYATRLMPEDWDDPIAAYEARIKDIEKKLVDLASTRDDWIPEREAELRVLDGLYPDRVDEWGEIRSYVAARRKGIARDIKDFEEALATLRPRVASLKNGALPPGHPRHDAKAAQTLRDIQRMARDPHFLALQDQFRADVRALQDRIDAKPLPEAKPPEGVMTWAQYWDFIKQARSEHPNSWPKKENGGD